MAAIKLFLAGFGTYLFARRIGQSLYGGLMAGITFGFGLYVVVHLMYPIGSVFVLIPLLLVAVHDLVTRPGPWPGLAFALLVALAILAGHPESTLHAVGLAVAYAVFRVATAPRDGPRARTAAAWVVGAGLVGGALPAWCSFPSPSCCTTRRTSGTERGWISSSPPAGCPPSRCPSTSGRPRTPPAARCSSARPASSSRGPCTPGRCP